MDNYCKVLIIDDEQLLRQGLKYLINWNEKGYEIIGEAENGEAAIKMVEANKPDIIITDIVMPVMDGVEFIKYIKQIYPEIVLIVLSSYNKFEYVKSTFKYGIEDYILKPTLGPEELLNTLEAAKVKSGMFKRGQQTNKEVIIDRVFNKMLSDDRIKKDDIDFLRNRCNYERYVMGCCIITNEQHSNVVDKYMDSHPFSIGKQIITVTKDNYCVFIIGCDTYKEGITLKWIKEQLEVIKLNTNITFALSDSFEHLENSKKVFNQLCSLLQYNYYMADAVYIDMKMLTTYKDQILFANKEYNQQVNQLNVNKAYEILLTYIKAVEKSKHMEPYDLKRQCQSALYTIISELDSLELGITELTGWKFSYSRDIDNTRNIGELLDVIGNMFNAMNALLKNHLRYNDAAVKKIIQYIDDNYNRQIQLSDVAEALFLNYSYLSHYFNHKFDTSFNDYLNSIRIKKAMKLLKRSNKTISEISEIVGYSDQSYFGKVFKKLNGMTPSNYRNR